MNNSVYKYSPSTRGWYLESLHGEDMPADAVPVSIEEYRRIRQAESDGLEIVPGENGYPTPQTYTPTAEQSVKQLTDNAADLLAKSDLVLMRCYERGQKIPKQWVAYRETLRHIVRQDPAAISSGIPERPDYPA